jgi:hypothetical protein
LVTIFVKEITGELVATLVADNEKGADTLEDFVFNGDDDGNNVGEVEVDRLKCEDDESVDELVDVADTEKSAESVAVDDNTEVALNVTLEVTDNKADCDIVSEFEVVALVVIEFVARLVCEKVDFKLSNGTLE